MSTAGTTQRLDLTADPVALTAALVDIESVSGNEAQLADAVQAALAGLGTFAVDRDGDAVVARTDLGRPSRVVLAGHLDTVPVADNLPSRLADGIMHGLGTCDMKSGVAVMLHVAATLPDPAYDLTLVCYDHEEVESELNGLGRLSANHPDWLAGDFAILLEPSNAVVEAGCQGTLRVDVTVTGRRAHSARSWMGSNAIHALAPVLDRLVAYEARTVDIDGCTYREGMNAVRVAGGVAGNVIPDACTVEVNYRFAPDRSADEAAAHVRELLAGYECRLVDAAPGALPGLSHPTAAAFVDAVGGTPRAKLGWTDVSRFAALGLPAVNFGPGDPNVAHAREEHVPVAQIVDATAALRRYLASPPA